MIVTQGAKEVVVGGEAYRYGAAQSLLVSVDIPAAARVVEASPDRPCLTVRISLDPAVVGELLADGTAASPAGPPERGLGVMTVERPLLDAVVRLVSLLDTPRDIAALSPLVLMHQALTIPRLKHEAQIDGKTGVYNARHFGTLWTAELERARRFNRPLAFIMAGPRIQLCEHS